MWKKMVMLVGLMAMLLVVSNINPSGRMVWAQEEAERQRSPALSGEEPSQTKITKIVLYKHGMGYFERQGKVKDDATINLSFKTEQMKDLLTSLFAIDLSGGKISTIGYDSKDPIEKQMENILIRVPEGRALTHFLAQLKGAKIEVQIANDTARGHILGIEPVQQKIEDSVLTAYKLVLLREDGRIQPFNLLEVNSMKLLDEPIQKDLKRILDIYLKSKYTDRKTVQLKTMGQGERDILIGYLIEMPIWKTSYRLILDEKKKPYLQGWAILENPTDEDWDNVQLTFVAGNPISFKLDLYTSYYPQRPVISLASLIPMVGALFDSTKLAYAEMGIGGGAGGQYGRSRGGRRDLKSRSKKTKAEYSDYAKPTKDAPAAMRQRPQLSELMSSSISAIARGTPVGELFAYEAKSPVSIQRHKAAMVPIITENVAGNKVLYYRATISPRPMNAFYLTNNTKLTLETGPVTLFEGSTSVGEGLLKKSLQPKMKEIIPYAMETGCTIEPVTKSHNKPVHKASLTNGILVLTSYNIYEKVYKCINKTEKDYVFYIDHAKAGGYKLIEPKKPEEEIEGYYRFKTKLKAGATVEFKVQEQMETSSSVYLRNISLDQIRFYIEQPYLSKQVKAFLGELMGLMNQIAEQDRIHKDAQQEYKRLAEDQRRYRENMRALNTHNPKEQTIRAKYVAKLDKVEDRIGTLRGKMLEAQDTKRALEAELVKKIQGFKEE